METLVDLFELHEGRNDGKSARSPRATIDLEVEWHEEAPSSSPSSFSGVPSESWNRARGWSSEDY